ncbi:hypothetical protein QQ008_21820 [Fulvivirgaceae bacterium BMA10]|uniref:Uncharacterized protein n=1 Tax=Splendidivirga corallicola TaxID=3051826 RepID=A0ABT8KX90_9BACT|nr:hypothetical protein [Fulvivirgaceae bacterium BMA10]
MTEYNRITFLIVILFLFSLNASFAQNDSTTLSSDLEYPDIKIFQGSRYSNNNLNPEPAIYSLTNLTANQLFTHYINLDEQAIIISPTWFAEPSNFKSLNLNLKAARQRGVSNFGLGFGLRFNKNKPIQIHDRVVSKYQGLHRNILAMTNETVKKSELERFRGFYYNNIIDEVYKESSKYITLQAGLNAQFFELFQKDNFEAFKGFNASAGINFSLSQKSGIHINYNYTEKKASGAVGTPTVLYQGGSFTASTLIVLNKDYVNSENYIQHMFIPGLELGIAVEYQEAMENLDFAEDNIVKQLAISPILDFKFSPKMQFRVALPIKSIDLNDGSQITQFTPIVQYAIQISDLKL